MSNDRGVKNIVTIENDKKIEWYKNSHALVIGNGNYQKGWDKLPGAIEDAKKVAKALENNGFVVDLHLDLTKQKFVKILSEFVIKKGQAIDDRVLLYFAGHGFTEKLASGEDLGYLIMVNSDKPETDFLNFTLTSVDMASLIIVAKKIRARHALFIFDSCFSGSFFNLREKVIPVKVSKTAMLPVRQFITAGQANEPVPDKSVFTQAFVDILQGRDKEPIPDGFLTGEELGLYLKTKVPEYNPNQHPQYGKLRSPNLDKGDFIFSLDGVKSSVVQTIEFHEKGVVAEDDLIRSKPLEVLDNNLENSIDKSSQNLLEMEFKYISPGTFMMGSPHSDEDQQGDETYRKVTLTQGFYMGLTEVTQGQWLKIMKSNPSHFSECGENCPVENVTWSEIQEFIRILNERDKEGYIYRLPTEAEWEYSARGGDSNIYLTGHHKNYKSIAWSFENSGYRTCPVGRKNANTNGLYDIIGNVWEYCQDYYISDISEKETIDPIGPISGKGHVIRGNGYYDYRSKCRVANRDQIILGQRKEMLGFRLVRQKI